uniref:Uncharacterized protein n=1 Tax=Nelumbo nucifera TaxID=4432 RepID=A0A822YX66_NELNU|nr:TPA_asm: hypothetical protein HUJ06_006569 [Nelumbo nucifera]
MGSTAITEVAQGTSTPTNKPSFGLQHAQVIRTHYCRAMQNHQLGGNL